MAKKNMDLPKDVKKALVNAYKKNIEDDSGNMDEKVAYAKFFSPYSSWTAFAVDFDGEDMFFGLVYGPYCEAGYFGYTEMKTAMKCGVPLIERDEHWTPKTIKECKEEMKKRGYSC